MPLPDDDFDDDFDDDIEDTDYDAEEIRERDDWESRELYREEVAQDWQYLSDFRGDPAALRHVRYTTGEDAQNFLDAAGLAAFSEVIYIEDEDLFTIAVYDSPGAR